MPTERIAAVIHAEIETAVDRSWLRRSRGATLTTAFVQPRRLDTQRSPPDARNAMGSDCSPEGDFAVWELPCRSIVGFGWVGERNALGRDLRVAEVAAQVM